MEEAEHPTMSSNSGMAHLTLTGVSSDGKRLLLVDTQGAEFTLDISPSLRAALRGDASRLGQLEIKMDSALRPRDIQARIRAGETAEAVALAAQTSVDKIMAFVAPVLAERLHIAERAQSSNLRRTSGEAGQGRTLGNAVEAHLHSCNLDPSLVSWDAWRREDGRWTLNGAYVTEARTGAARFTFDAPGNYVMLDNDDARWLVGEAVASPAPARDDLQPARQRRLSSVPQDELPLGDDAIDLVSEPEPQPEPDVAAYDETPVPVPVPVPVEAFFEDAPTPADVPADEPDVEVEESPAARRPVQKKKGRASVPSWDEIMFGGGDQG